MTGRQLWCLFRMASVLLPRAPPKASSLKSAQRLWAVHSGFPLLGSPHPSPSLSSVILGRATVGSVLSVSLLTSFWGHTWACWEQVRAQGLSRSVTGPFSAPGLPGKG